MNRFYRKVYIGYSACAGYVRQSLALQIHQVCGEYRSKRRGRQSRPRHAGKGVQ